MLGGGVAIEGSLERAATYIQSALVDAGHSVTKQIYRYLDRRMVNLIGTTAAAVGASQFYVVGAHYDTVPTTPGADDNTSQVGSALNELLDPRLELPVPTTPTLRPKLCKVARRLRSVLLICAFTENSQTSLSPTK